MSKYHDDSTFASDPGQLALSMAKLAALEPELLTERTFRCGPHCPVDHPAKEMVERVAEHLQVGDSRAAFVVSVEPLLVAAYSSDLDAVALLRFPQSFVVTHRLHPGMRLLTVNTYHQFHDRSSNAPLYAADLVPGPERTGWSNFSPFIAEFLSDDTGRIQARKSEISELEWSRARARAQVRLAELGPTTARDGRPSLSGTPVKIGGSGHYELLSQDWSYKLLKRLHALYPVHVRVAKIVLATLLVALVAFALLRK